MGRCCRGSGRRRPTRGAGNNEQAAGFVDRPATAGQAAVRPDARRKPRGNLAGGGAGDQVPPGGVGDDDGGHGQDRQALSSGRERKRVAAVGARV